MVSRRPLLIVPLLACAAWLVLHEFRVTALGGVDLGFLSSRFAHDVVLALAAALCLARGVVVRSERAAWLLIGAGVLAWTLGEVYYTVVLWDESSPPIPSPAASGEKSPPPPPSPATAASLLSPPLTFTGMLVLLRSRASIKPALLVDG